MYHSITFIGPDNTSKNTWNDWCLIPETDPIVVPPTQKTNYLDIPGASGSLDMSEVLTGYPLFNNREGSFTFFVMNESAVSQPECHPDKLRRLASEIMNYLRGKEMRMILEDDSSYYYKGRFFLESASPEEEFSKISIKYNVEPYKRSMFGIIDEWLWDPFNFTNGVIIGGSFTNITVTTSWQYVELTENIIGTAPVTADYTVSSLNGQGVYIRFINPRLGIDITKLLPNGTHNDPDFVIYGDGVRIGYRVSSSTGTLTINYNAGRL